MSWTIKISSNAEKYYKKLDKSLKKIIKKNLLTLSQQENPLEHSQVRALTGELKGFYRLRIGDYRIIFALLKEERIIAVVNIFPRSNGY